MFGDRSRDASSAPAGAQVVGTVVDDDTGEPIADAIVSVQASHIETTTYQSRRGCSAGRTSNPSPALLALFLAGDVLVRRRRKT